MSKLIIDLADLTTHDGRPLTFTRDQLGWIRSLKSRSALVGGFGSGKTLPFCVKAILLAILHGPGYRGQLVSPTYDMMQRVLIPTLRDDILLKLGDPDNGRSLWDLSSWSPSRRELILPNGFTLSFGSADKPERLRGTNLAFLGIDEASMVDQFGRLWVSAGSRLRRARPNPYTGEPMAQLFLCTTPEGFDQVYETFVEGPQDARSRRKWQETHELVTISTRDNPGIDLEFIEQMLLGIPEPLLPAYLDGQYVDVGRGRCYYNFGAANVREEAIYDQGLDLHLSWDFNADPMSLTIHQLLGGGQNAVLMQIDEIVLRNSNTPEVCREFIRKYGNEGARHGRDLFIYGDASDAVGVSNYDEIEDYLHTHFIGTIRRRVPRSNPRHLKRLKSVNAACRSAAGTIRYWVHPRCKWTIRDLKHQRMDKNGISKDKKQEADDGTTLGHASDTVDYIIERLFPHSRPDVRGAMRSRLTAHLS